MRLCKLDGTQCILFLLLLLFFALLINALQGLPFSVFHTLVLQIISRVPWTGIGPSQVLYLDNTYKSA